MRWTRSTLVALLCLALGSVHASPVVPQPADRITALERAALDRWGRGDPSGFLETYSPEVSYFDVGTEHRLDGLEAMTEYYRPFTGRINISRYEMIDPLVQQHGDVAVLSYNLVSEVVNSDGSRREVRWNSTSVYAREAGAWKMIHSHWSLTAPPCLRGTI